jgi:hypothetical protein
MNQKRTWLNEQGLPEQTSPYEIDWWEWDGYPLKWDCVKEGERIIDMMVGHCPECNWRVSVFGRRE